MGQRTTPGQRYKPTAKGLALRSALWLSPIPLSVVTGAAGAQEGPSELLLRWPVWHPEAATTSAEAINDLHLLLFWLMVGVCLLVMALLAYVVLRFRAGRHPTPSSTTHNTAVEVLWTILPIIILVAIAIPSFRTLYAVDRIEEADLTIKAIGYQWYWGYEYPDEGIAFDALPIGEESLQPGQPRLLQTDNAVVVPLGAKVRLLTTAGDVLHSFGVPAFGLKLDAVPGQVNETWFQTTREGTFYGQCSELCGINHYFMPIMIRVVSPAEYEAWVAETREELTRGPDEDRGDEDRGGEAQRQMAATTSGG